MQSNSLSSSVIYPGQALNVAATVYTVKAGDSLYLIAKKYVLLLDDLRKANNKWDNYLYPGQTLILPGISSSSVPVVSTPVVSTPIVPYTASDLDLLARLITSEAQGEPYNAQVSVGAVVLNRVKDSRFPSTIRGVIYEVSGGYYQFTPVLNGYINKPASLESIRAAKDALNGHLYVVGQNQVLYV